MEPLVSICMPAYNASRWIGAAIESALSQTWEDFELVIADNASTDSTLDIARSYDDPRLRVFASDVNIGHVGNHERAIALSTGRYIKFLHADDALTPDCVEEMVKLARSDERIGLVFAKRELVIYDAEGMEWVRMETNQHKRFGRLDRVNDGRALFVQILGAGIDDNWLGEPSAVLLSREAVERCGRLNRRVRESVDLELYLRIMLRYRVGYVDKSLCLHRQHDESVTAGDAKVNRNWLDALWLLEGLLSDEALGPTRPSVHHLRRQTLEHVLRKQLRRLAKGQFTAELPAYLRYRMLPTGSRRAWLYGQPGQAPSTGVAQTAHGRPRSHPAPRV